jgi:iron complex transport system substrate-binding protein
MTVNNQHLISDVIRVCGGTNVFALSSSLTPVVSGENLLAADPDAIISSVLLEQEESALAEVKAFLRQFSQLSAVRNNNIFFVHPDLIQRQTTRVLQGTRLVCEQLERVRSRRKIDRLTDPDFRTPPHEHARRQASETDLSIRRIRISLEKTYEW